MSVSSDAKRTVRKVTAGEAEIDPAAEVCAADEKKSKKQLLDEIIELRQRLNARTALDPVRQAIETELKGTRHRLQCLLAISPAIIYTNKASGDFTCTFVSENLGEIMGYSPQEMTTNPKCWSDYLHPEDAPRVFEALIDRGMCKGSFTKLSLKEAEARLENPVPISTNLKML